MEKVGRRRGCLALMVALAAALVTAREAGATPVIGILAQEPSGAVARAFPGHASYIAASYVKAVEASGARVVPLFINKTREYYREMVAATNGLLLPGGAAWFFRSSGYAQAGSHLIQLAKDVNRDGSEYPVLGICLGMELLLFEEAGRREYRADCWSKNLSLPLSLKARAASSRLFATASPSILDILTTQNVTYNQHQFCVTEKNMSSFGLSGAWRVLSTNLDEIFGLEFVSSVEAVEWPFAGVQFHPEKNAFEWREDLQISHTKDSIVASRHFFDWLVTTARRNSHSFRTKGEESAALIYNYRPVNTKGRLIYQQLYLF